LGVAAEGELVVGLEKSPERAVDFGIVIALKTRFGVLLASLLSLKLLKGAFTFYEGRLFQPGRGLDDSVTLAAD
jgi:hypothetical protein